MLDYLGFLYCKNILYKMYIIKGNMKIYISYRRDFVSFQVVETCDYSFFDFFGNSEDAFEIFYQEQDQDSGEFVSYYFVLDDVVSECVQDQCFIVYL